MIFLRIKYEDVKKKLEAEQKGEGEDGGKGDDDWGLHRKGRKGRTKSSPKRPMRKASPRGRGR
jgi:hypothetical protein